MPISEDEQEAVRKEIARWVQIYGAVPPPWQRFPDSHPYSIRWRMGAGEYHMMVFQQWWESHQFPEDQRIAYFRRWPPPPRWLEWMMDILWDLPMEEEGFDSTPYFERLESLGFGNREAFERDINDPQWA